MNQAAPLSTGAPATVFGAVGRGLLTIGPATLACLAHTGQVWSLFVEATAHSTVGVVRGRTKMRKQLFPLLMNVGARSLPIVAIVAVLTGAVLVLQTGDVLRDFGQISEAPGLVALSMTRALGPLMTAIVLVARVGASYTAVLGSMAINEELMALRTMSINPIAYLVAPRFISMIVMAPCLVLFAYVCGMAGGGVVAQAIYQIPPALYIDKTFDYLTMSDVLGGMLKATVFGLLIALISCHHGLRTSGGPTGLGRNIMVSVVTSVVMVTVADALLTALLINYIL